MLRPIIAVLGGMILLSASHALAAAEIAGNKRFGSILNNDINNILWALSGSKTTPAEYTKAVMHLLDAKPGVLAQNVGMPDPVIYRTKVATTWDRYHNQVVAAVWGKAQANKDTQARCMKALLDAGTDPLTITLAACRQRGVPIVTSYRMNAEDFYGGELDLYDFGRANKDLRIPGANCLDPVHSKVFEHRMRIFTEVANEYDIDGIEFDFRRWTHMISKPRDNHPMLTKMVRHTRKMLDEVAKKKGRKRLLLGVRVGPTIAGKPLGRTDMSCKDLGLDVTTWIKQHLVDYVCPSFFWGHNPGNDPKTAEFVALAKGTNVGIYPTVFPYSKWQKKNAQAERIDPDEADDLRRYRDDILNAALKCYAEGADGISTFNWVPHQQPGMTQRNMRESWGLGAAKVQMVLHPMLGDRSALEACLKSDVVLPKIARQTPGHNGERALPKGRHGVDLAQLHHWNIVVATDAIASEVYAAAEFQALFRQASGLKLPIVHKIDRPDRHVFIGPGRPMQTSRVGFGVDGLGPEDLRIIARDNNVAIAGGRPRGTLYGVYTFLEDHLGVRFLTPDHTHVPPVSKRRVIGPVDRIYRPPFANYRGVGYAARYKHPVFGVRHRDNTLFNDPQFGKGTPYLSPFINTNHSFYRQVSIEKYGKPHPEYFGLWDGTRRNDYVHTHLCLTNPDLVPIVAKAAIDEIKHFPWRAKGNISVAQNDTIWQYCQCDKCSAIDEAEGSHMGALLRFVNAVADEVAKTYPDVHIGTLAYGFSRKPPKTTKPRPNVEINLCSIECCQIHALTDPNCPLNAAFMADLKGWSRICRNLYAWTYNINFHDALLPYPNLHTIGPNVRSLLAAGTKGAFMQCSPLLAGEMSDLRCYLISSLLWDATRDDKVLIDEFLDLHYGRAAAPIRRFINWVHEHYAKTGIHQSSCIKARWDMPVDDAIGQVGLKTFAEAMALAENETVRSRVEKASICAYRAAIDPIWRLEEGAAVDPLLAKRMRPLAGKFFQLCSKHGLDAEVAGSRKRIEGIWKITDAKKD